jgi:hypothetical protein
VNRSDLFAALEVLLAPIPVVDQPLESVMAPAVVLRSGAPYRFRTSELGWQTTWELLVLAGRTDDVRPYDTADEIADLLCAQIDRLPNMSAELAASAPDVLTVGNVDFVSFTFTFTDHSITGPCS